MTCWGMGLDDRMGGKGDKKKDKIEGGKNTQEGRSKNDCIPSVFIVIVIKTTVFWGERNAEVGCNPRNNSEKNDLKY